MNNPVAWVLNFLVRPVVAGVDEIPDTTSNGSKRLIVYSSALSVVHR